MWVENWSVAIPARRLRQPGSGLLVRLEDGFDRLLEQASQSERNRQAGVVPAGLQRVDGLTRHIQSVGKGPLSEPPRFA